MVDHQVVAVLNEVGHKVSDDLLSLNVCLVADSVGQVGLRAVAEDRTAVGLGGVALFFQLVQIAADGFFRHVVILGQLADENALLVAQTAQYFVFSFDC